MQRVSHLPVKLFFPSLAAFIACAAIQSSRAEEPYLKPDDVIALVGGEDMVAAGEQFGFLEFHLQRALPHLRLKVRNIAWEGDTVFEQARMLNYPKLEHQLDELGATVVIMQFGQMEYLKGKKELPQFIEAYESLIRRLRGNVDSRRLMILSPSAFNSSSSDVGGPARVSSEMKSDLEAYAASIRKLAGQMSAMYVDVTDVKEDDPIKRDGVHWNDNGQAIIAETICVALGCPKVDETTAPNVASAARLIPAIKAKNRLWDRYRRPQNWAFLAGDRVTQASSRDHIDPSKRWFPEEMKEFLPLIAAREHEIWDVAAKLKRENK